MWILKWRPFLFHFDFKWLSFWHQCQKKYILNQNKMKMFSWNWYCNIKSHLVLDFWNLRPKCHFKLISHCFGWLILKWNKSCPFISKCQFEWRKQTTPTPPWFSWRESQNNFFHWNRRFWQPYFSAETTVQNISANSI